MKKLLFIALAVLCVSIADAQVLNRFRGTLNVFGSSGTAPNYAITGFFNDQLGNYESDDVSVGDILYISSGSGCVRFRITSITSETGGIIQANILDVSGATSVFPGGIGAILGETANYDFPNYVSGISEDLLACMRTHFTELVDVAVTGDPADTVRVTDSQTIDLAFVGPQNITASVKVSPNANNVITAVSNGIYAAIDPTEVILDKPYFGLTTNLSAVLEYIEGNTHVHRDGQTINFITTTGTPKPDTISAEIIRSPDANNIIELRSNGIYATTTAFRIFEFVKDDAVIRASDTTGVTFSKSSGTGTITIPANIYLFSAAVKGVTADLDGSNNFKLVIATAASAINQGVSTTMPPNIDVLNTASQLGGGPSDSLPFIYDEKSTPQVQVTGVGTGDVTTRVINLNAFSNWIIKIAY